MNIICKNKNKVSPYFEIMTAHVFLILSYIPWPLVFFMHCKYLVMNMQNTYLYVFIKCCVNRFFCKINPHKKSEDWNVYLLLYIPAFAVCPHFRSSTRTKVQVKINKTVYTLHVDSVQLTLQISALKLKTLTYLFIWQLILHMYMYNENENEYKRNRTYFR